MSIVGLPSIAAVATSGKRTVVRLFLRWSSLSERIRVAVNKRNDTAFLPAHLEILDTPPSPMLRIFAGVICAMLALSLAWSLLAHLDIHAVAPGRIQPNGRSKVVQPFEISKVKTIRTTDGARVRVGDVLVELDPAEAEADVVAKRLALQTFDAQISRYRAALAAVQGQQPAGDEPAFSVESEPMLRERERAAMAADVADFRNSRSSLEAERDEKLATQQRYTASLAARQRLKAVLEERLTMKRVLANSASGTRAALLDAAQQVEQAAADLAYDEGQLKEAQAAAQSIERRIDQLTSTTIAKQSQALAEASEKGIAAEQDLRKAAMRLDRMRLRAPIDGTVQQLAVTTVGQVVTPGQPLLVVVPSSGTIEVNALVQNQDIGFVLPGQDVVVKIDAFPFTRYGTVEGRVTSVSRDAIDNRQAASADAIATTRGQDIDSTSGTPATRNLVFPVTVELERIEMMVDGKAVPLTAGMTVTAEIRTGNRRVVDYVLSPIKETTATAGHER